MHVERIRRPVVAVPVPPRNAQSRVAFKVAMLHSMINDGTPAEQIAAAKALGKLQDGTYFECSNPACPEAISAEQFKDNPAALYCKTCSAKLKLIKTEHPDSGLTDEQLLAQNQ